MYSVNYKGYESINYMARGERSDSGVTPGTSPDVGLTGPPLRFESFGDFRFFFAAKPLLGPLPAVFLIFVERFATVVKESLRFPGLAVTSDSIVVEFAISVRMDVVEFATTVRLARGFPRLPPLRGE